MTRDTLTLADKPGYRLRRPAAADRPLFLAFVQDAEAMRHQGGALTAAQAETFATFVYAHWEKHGFGHYVVAFGEESRGIVSLKALTTAQGTNYDVGFTIFPAHRGQGLATSAARALLGLAATVKAPLVSAMTLDGN